MKYCVVDLPATPKCALPRQWIGQLPGGYARIAGMMKLRGLTQVPIEEWEIIGRDLQRCARVGTLNLDGGITWRRA